MTSVETESPSASAQPAREEAIVHILKSIRPVNDAGVEMALINELTHPSQPTVLSFVNAHAINLAWNNVGLREAFLGSDVVLRDGIGVEIVLPWFQMPAGINMCGTDLIPKLISAFNGRPLAIFGTKSPWLENAKKVIEDGGGVITSMTDGFQDTDHYLELAAAHRPDIIVLAMGMPKQELLSIKLKNRLDYPVLIVNGGAVIDFMGGKVSRAPNLVRRVKLEWLYRLMLEPKRLFERYIIGNPLFLARCARISRTRPS